MEPTWMVGVQTHIFTLVYINEVADHDLFVVSQLGIRLDKKGKLEMMDS